MDTLGLNKGPMDEVRGTPTYSYVPRFEIKAQGCFEVPRSKIRTTNKFERNFLFWHTSVQMEGCCHDVAWPKVEKWKKGRSAHIHTNICTYKNIHL